MRKLFIAFSLLCISNWCSSQDYVQLAPPLLKYHSVFFKNVATVTLEFAQKGTQIHYTLDGSNPTEKDAIYHKPVVIEKSLTTLKALTTGAGYLPSAIVSATFIKDGLPVISVETTPPNERFPGSGPNTLIDNEGGLTNMSSKTWMGFQLDSVEIQINMGKKQWLSSVLIDFLQNEGSWVYLPQQITVLYYDDRDQSLKSLATASFAAGGMIRDASCMPELLKFSKKVHTDKIKIMLYGVKSIREGHPGNGQHGWIFIDEVKVY